MELQAAIDGLEKEAEPLRARVDELRREVDALRAELNRRRRLAQLEGRRQVRAELSGGAMPNLEEVVGGSDVADGTRFDELRFVRESATEVRLGYASAAHQSVSFTDGTSSADATDLATARELWRQGWEFGTPLARGVRIYPVGSRAERVVPAAEVHVAGSAEP